MKNTVKGIKNIGGKSGKVKVFLLLVLLLAVIVAVLYFTGILSGVGFGFGGNDDPDGTGSGSAALTTEEQAKIIAIRIDESSIYFGDELCADTEELKKKITDNADANEYELIHDNAIKSVYDEVVGVLAELESALEITVNYN